LLCHHDAAYCCCLSSFGSVAHARVTEFDGPSCSARRCFCCIWMYHTVFACYSRLLVVCAWLCCAGKGRYKLMAADLVATHTMMDHIGRYLPSVRMNGAAFSFVVDLIINYGSPVLHLVMVSGQRGWCGCVWGRGGGGGWVLWGVVEVWPPFGFQLVST
jgi:hypothetical protein